RPRPIAIGCGRGCITSTSSGWTCWSWPPACRTPPRSPRNTKCRRWKQPSASFVTRRSIRSRDCSRITGGCVSTLPWFGKRKEGWFTDMFTAGFEGEDLPADERWRAIQWLGERTAKDPRFAVAMTEHVYYLLTGRKVLLPPKDFEDPLYGARLRAFREQRNLTEAIAGRFAKTGFNLKAVFKDWILSDFYRADALATAVREPCRQAEFDDIGLVRMLSPEQLERKVAAVFGEKWNRLDGEMAMLYGGIDSKEVTDRATDPSGAMGAIQRILSNDVACRHVGRDFGKPANERRLFPNIEPDVLPGASEEGDQAIRKAIAFLHEKVLGRYDAIDSAEV